MCEKVKQEPAILKLPAFLEEGPAPKLVDIIRRRLRSLFWDKKTGVKSIIKIEASTDEDLLIPRYRSEADD